VTLRIKAAFSRYKTGVTQAGIVKRAVPTAPLPPFGPCEVIAIFGVGISRFPGRTVDALGGVARMDRRVPGHRGSRQHRTKDCGSADQCEFHDEFLRFVLVHHNRPARGSEIPGGAFFFGLASRAASVKTASIFLAFDYFNRRNRARPALLFNSLASSVPS
jgi:hypothetical protein